MGTDFSWVAVDLDIRLAGVDTVLESGVPVMTFRAVDERDTALACEWAPGDGDYGRHWSSESSWKKREETEGDRGLHGDDGDVAKD